MIQGRVIEERKNYFVVMTEDGEEYRSLLKGKIRKKLKRLSVGDLVSIDIFDEEKHEAVVKKVEKRINELPRPSVANIDQVLFVNCLIHPALDFGYMDRFLFACSVAKISVHLVFNKSDLLSEDGLEGLNDVVEMYQKAGYEHITTSTSDDDSVEKLRNICQGKLTVFAGPSGVGKSSLMQKLFPEHEFITNELSEHISRGKNTTTHTSLLPLNSNSFIADTPGFSYMKIPKILPAEVSHHFDDINELANDCKFNNCLHRDEPSCAIKDAVQDGEISDERYDNYLELMSDMENAQIDYKNRSIKYF